MSDYFIKVKDEQKGPYSEGQLRSMWSIGIITSDTVFREAEGQSWQPIARLLEPHASPTGTAPQKPAPQPSVPPPERAPRKKNQAVAIAVLGITLAFTAGIILGNIHIINGGDLQTPRIVQKESFGFTETFINIDAITHMPWISARSRYPLSCAVLRRENLIESEEEFRKRRDKEMKEEMQKALHNLSK